MKKLISLPFILFLLTFNAQNDGDIYNIKSYVSDNIELIKNTNTEKVKDRIKFNLSLRNHVIRNSGLIDNYLFQFRLNKELNFKMSKNENYIKLKNKNFFLGITLISCVLSSAVTLAIEPFFGLIVTFIVILPITVLLATVSQIGTIKLRTQLIKDYFLLVNQTL